MSQQLTLQQNCISNAVLRLYTHIGGILHKILTKTICSCGNINQFQFFTYTNEALIGFVTNQKEVIDQKVSLILSQLLHCHHSSLIVQQCKSYLSIRKNNIEMFKNNRKQDETQQSYKTKRLLVSWDFKTVFLHSFKNKLFLLPIFLTYSFSYLYFPLTW